MKKIITFFCALIILILLSPNTYADSNSRTGDKLYAQAKYSFAIPYYLESLKKEANVATMQKLAECYRFIKDNKNAEIWYAKLVKGAVKKPENFYYYAQALMQSGKYEEAKVQFKNYELAKPVEKRKIQLLISSCDSAIIWRNNPTGAVITNEKSLNTPYSDFSPIITPKGLVFTSDRIDPVINSKNKPAVQSNKKPQSSKKETPKTAKNKNTPPAKKPGTSTVAKNTPSKTTPVPVTAKKDSVALTVKKDTIIAAVPVKKDTLTSAVKTNAQNSYNTVPKTIKEAKERLKSKDSYGWSGNGYAKLLTAAKYDTVKGWTDIKPLSIKIVDDKEKVSTNPKKMPKKHYGTASFSKDFKTIYFTYNRNTNNPEKLTDDKRKLENFINRNEIYYATLNDGKLTTKPLGLSYNNIWSYSVQHPSFSQDGSKVYFASDMPGGLGKFDLYFSERVKDNIWTTPVNLGSNINTVEDELFPTIVEDKTLYFASNGRIGFGGLDLYITKAIDAKCSDPENLGYPLNSPQDDFGITWDADNQSGFLTSNRDGGAGGDDIYRFKVSCEIEGIIVNKKTQAPMPGARVKFTELNQLSKEIITDESGKYKFAFSGCQPSEIATFKTGFNTARTKIAMVQGKVSTPYLKIELEQGIAFELQGMAVEKGTGAALDSVTLKLTKLNPVTVKTPRRVVPKKRPKKGQRPVTTVTPAATVQQPVPASTGPKIFQAGANGKFSIELEKESDYSLVATRRGYLSDNISLISTKNKGQSTTFNVELKLEKIILNKAIKVDNIYYDKGKAIIRKDAAKELDKLVAMMQNTPEIKIELSSHTDSRGSDAANLTLSLKRAQSAVKYVISKGISKDRIVAKGYGEIQLLNECGNGVKCTEEQHQVNRRTEFKVIGFVTPK
ncbi:MAG: OmpA family protein [Daejeonella sp.]